MINENNLLSFCPKGLGVFYWIWYCVTEFTLNFKLKKIRNKYKNLKDLKLDYNGLELITMSRLILYTISNAALLLLFIHLFMYLFFLLV